MTVGDDDDDAGVVFMIVFGPLSHSYFVLLEEGMTGE